MKIITRWTDDFSFQNYPSSAAHNEHKGAQTKNRKVLSSQLIMHIINIMKDLWPKKKIECGPTLKCPPNEWKVLEAYQVLYHVYLRTLVIIKCFKSNRSLQLAKVGLGQSFLGGGRGRIGRIQTETRYKRIRGRGSRGKQVRYLSRVRNWSCDWVT